MKPKYSFCSKYQLDTQSYSYVCVVEQHRQRQLQTSAFAVHMPRWPPQDPEEEPVDPLSSDEEQEHITTTTSSTIYHGPRMLNVCVNM